MPYIPKDPKPSVVKPITKVEEKKTSRKLRIKEPKIDMRNWDVDPRRLESDLKRGY